jgi:hypothetical protein
MAQIVLPKTEQSQMESSQGESMQVVGYVNVNPGVSAITPVQPEPNSAQGIEAGPSPMPAPAAPQPETETQPILATANTSLSFKPPQTEGKIPPTVAGGNYTWSATGPNSAPVVELPSVSAIVPSPSSVPTQAVPESALASAGTFPSAAPAPAPEELSDSIREKALKDRSNFYGGGVGGGGGGGAGGIGFRTGVIPSNAYANNTFGLSGQAGLGSGTVSFGGAINGTPHLSPSDNITITNAIAENQGAFYRSINNSAGEGEEGQQPVLNWRLYQNPNNASQDDYKKIGVTPISGSAAPPTGMGNASAAQTDQPLTPPQANAPIPQPEIQTRDNAFSTFSLNVSDVSFKLASASLGNGLMPNPASIRGEEFINAFDYHDPEPLQGQPLAFMSERARDPFAQERDFLRFSIKAAAMGRQEGRA